MADFHRKYYYSFKSVTDVNYTVEIWEDVPSGDPAPFDLEVEGDSAPAVLQYNADRIHTPVRGSGAELTLFSETDRMFFSLFTANMMLYQVRIYKTHWITPLVSVEMLVWVGFLDSENYSEPFDMATGYPVSVTANDGFNLLSRMNYIEYTALTDTFTKYSGIETMWIVLQRIIQKLNLPWENIYVGLSITIPEITLGADETILEYLYVNNENYYNEDDEPETCRTVLENLLKPLGAFIIQVGGSLIITDSHYIASGSTATFKKFEYVFEATAYLADVSLTINQGDISTLGVESSKITLQVDPGINKQIVSYSPYALNKLIDFDPVKDFSAPGTTTTTGAAGYRWTETEYGASELWTKYGNGSFCSYVGADPANNKNTDAYLKIENYGLTGEQYYNQIADETRHSFKYKLPLPWLISSQDYYLRIDMSAYFRTLDDLGGTPTVGVKAGFLTTRLKIGGKKFTGGFFNTDTDYFRWVDAVADAGLDLVLMFRDNYDDYNNYPINDMWVNLDIKKNIFYFQDGVFKTGVEKLPYLIPLTGAEGVIEFDIYGYRVYDESTDIWTEIEIPDCRLKNIKLSITDKDGAEIALSDYEYLSKLDANYSNAGEDVTLYHGTNIDGYPIQRGNILLSTATGYAPINGLNKAGDTDIPEKLLLRSIKSNYGTANIKLSVDLPVIFDIGYVTYGSFLSGKNLHILSNRIDLDNNVSSVELREIHEDTAIII